MHEQLRDDADGYHFKERAKACETRRVERSSHFQPFATELFQNCGRHVHVQVVENAYSGRNTRVLQCLGQFVAVTLPSQADVVLVSFENNTIGNDARCRRRSRECCISNGFGSFSRLRALCRPPLFHHALTISYRANKYSHPVTAPRAPGLRLRCGKPGHAPEWRGGGRGEPLRYLCFRVAVTQTVTCPSPELTKIAPF